MTPSGVDRCKYLLNPASTLPRTGMLSERTSGAILTRYSALLIAVLISIGVYFLGLPICSVNSAASVSVSLARRERNFVRISTREDRVG